MARGAVRAAWLCLVLAGGAAAAEGPVLPQGDKTPLLKIDAGGPTSFITSLAFSPDGQKLYAAGWDKVVRVWTLRQEGKDERFELSDESYRVPMGRDLVGAINAIALSDDGTWLAVGGFSPYRSGTGYRGFGLVLPVLGAMTRQDWQDVGLIYLFNTQTRQVRLLRGQAGPVFSLAFGSSRGGKTPLLVSAGREVKESGEWRGSVRVWDADGEEQCLKAADLPDVGENWRPSLAAWHGPDGGGLQVALGWGDEFFRVWDCNREDGLRKHPNFGKNNYTQVPVAFFRCGSEDRCVTAIPGFNEARLCPWEVSPRKQLRPAAFVQPLKQAANHFPKALALLSAGGDGRLDHAAVITRHGDPPAYDLQVLDLGGGQVGKVTSETYLWTNAVARQPVLAAAPGGRYLALAGDDRHDILVYSIAKILEGNFDPQVLHSAGATVQYLAFVKKGDSLGLLLKDQRAPDGRPAKQPGAPPRPPRPGDMVFDFPGRRLVADLAGWQLDEPDMGKWRVTSLDLARPTLEVTGGKEPVRIMLPEGAKVTDFALLPPRPRLDRPILAVAYHTLGHPKLALFDTSTGARFRELTGHTGRVLCLAFSGDGNRLASASEDQTVCVWDVSPNHLQKVLGNHGMLPGLAVRNRDGAVVVGKVDPGSVAEGKLRVGDTVLGLVDKDGLSPLKSARAFYDAISLLQPGDTVTLRVRGDGDDANVALPVGQAVDERMPLLSLFVTRDGKAEERDWIGWCPVGPFDTNSIQAAQRYAGWHFNTGEAEAPTRFAFLDQYRKGFYQEGVLDELVRKGFPGSKPPPPDPVLLPSVEEGRGVLRPDALGQLLTRHARVTLKLRLLDRTRDALKSVVWRVDGGEEQPFPRVEDGGKVLRASLSLTRGEHTVEIFARTRERPLRLVPAPPLKVRYQPPPPVVPPERISITFPGGKPPQRQGAQWFVQVAKGTGKEKPITIQLGAEVTAGPGANVELRRDGETHNPAVKLPVRENIDVRPGSHRIELIAVNQGAPKEHAELETTRTVLDVVVNEVAPPVIALNWRAEGMAEAKEIKPGARVVVTVPQVHIGGTIKAEDGRQLAAAHYSVGAKKGFGERHPLAGFQPDKPEAAVSEDVKLARGPQELVFHAEAGAGFADLRFEVYYQVPTPAAKLIQPRNGQVVEGIEPQGQVPLEAQLIPPREMMRGQSDEKAVLARMPPYKKVILVNDRPVDASPRVDGATLTAQVPLQPGANRVQVRLTNDWEGGSTSDAVVVYYWRRPVVTVVQPPQQAVVAARTVDVEAEVVSPLPLRPGSVRVQVNGHDQRLEKEQVKMGAPPAPGTKEPLRLTVRRVRLEVGEDQEKLVPNEITLRVSNEEGESQPAQLLVRYKPPEKPAIIDFTWDGKAKGPDTTVPFRVTSRSRLQRVALVVEGEEGQGSREIDADLSGVKRTPRGDYVLDAEVPLKLTAQQTRVHVLAVNAAGDCPSRPLPITFPRKPVTLRIRGLLLPDGTPLKRAALEHGALRFRGAPAAQVILSGEVTWEKEADAPLDETKAVRVFVNGFQQLPALLQAAVTPERVRTFQVKLLLNQKTDNFVALTLPTEIVSEDSDTKALVNCAEPAQARRLHVLVLSRPTDKDEEALKKMVLGAFHAKATEGNGFKTSTFQEGILYTPLIGDDVRLRYLMPTLDDIKGAIEGAAEGQSPGTELVLFYYRGQEVLNPQGQLFQSDITVDDLQAAVADMPGAHVLLFDVDHLKKGEERARDRIDQWEKTYSDVAHHVALLRYAWLEPSRPPRTRQLMRDLDDAMRQAVPLGEVLDLVKKSSEQPPSFPELLRDKEYVPPDMRRTPFGLSRE